jgi:hypothetical protein
MRTPYVVALSLVVAAEAALPRVDAHAQAIPAPSITVALDALRQDEVSGIAWAGMTSEARAIWAREGVELTWNTTDAATLRLPVSFDDHAVRKYDKSAALGMTLFTGRSQHILISVPRSDRLVRAAASDVSAPDGTLGRDIYLGRLLGRVLAHEIGHALLLTKRHSAYGLMSGNITPREVPPFNNHPLALSVSEREKLATRFSNIPEPARRSVVVERLPSNAASMAGITIPPVR